MIKELLLNALVHLLEQGFGSKREKSSVANSLNLGF
jgi:hypothetical protein